MRTPLLALQSRRCRATLPCAFSLPQLGFGEKSVLCVAPDTPVIEALAGMADRRVPGELPPPPPLAVVAGPHAPPRWPCLPCCGRLARHGAAAACCASEGVSAELSCTGLQLWR